MNQMKKTTTSTNKKELLIEEAKKMLLDDNYKIWVRGSSNWDWSLSSYSTPCEINNVYDFWGLFNNFNNLKYMYYHIFLMKIPIAPMYEDRKNNSILSVKHTIENGKIYFSKLSQLFVSGKLLIKNASVVNGIAFTPKSHFILIKLWLNTKSDISNEFKKLPINIEFKVTETDHKEITENDRGKITPPNKKQLLMKKKKFFY